MTAGAEVLCNDVVRKVEIEERCVAGFDASDLNEVGAVATVGANVGGNGNGNVGGDGKDDADDSSYVFVSGGVEVSPDDPGDTGGVNVDDCALKSNSNEVDQFKKEELGIEQGGIPVDPLVLETNGFVQKSATASDAEVKAVTHDVNLENGSTVDPSVVLETDVIALDANCHLDKIAEEGAVLKSAEEGAVVKSTEEVEDAIKITNVGAEIDDVSEVTPDPEFTLTTIESSQATDFESEYTIKQSEESRSHVTISQSLSTPDVSNSTSESLSTPYIVRSTDCEEMVNDRPESISTLIVKAEYPVTVDESGKPSEDLGCQVTADGSEDSVCPSEEREGQVKVDGSGELSEDLRSQVKVDEPKSCGSPIKELECEVSVDGSDSIGSLADNHECPVSVDEFESSGNHTEEVEANTIVMGSEEHQELLVINSEVNVEAEPNHISGGTKTEFESEPASAPYPFKNNKVEGTEIGSGAESEGNPDTGPVLFEEADALAEGQAQKFDGILLMGETQISGTEADVSVLLLLNAEKAKLEEKSEKQVEDSSETVVKITESVEKRANSEEEEVKIEDEIQESQIVVIDNVQNDLNLQDNTAESAKEAEVPLETETNIEPVTKENTASQYEVSNCVDKPQEVFQLEESAERFETIDQVKSECNKGELLVEKENDLLSNPNDLTVVEQKVEILAHLGTENAGGMGFGTGIEKLDVSDDEEKEIEVKGAPKESLSHLVTEDRSAESMDCGTGVEDVNVPGDENKETEAKDAPIESLPHLVTENISDEGMDCGTVATIVTPDDEEKETEVKGAPVGDHSTLSFHDTIVNHGAVIEFGSIGRPEATPAIRNDDFISVPGTDSDSPEGNVDGSHGERNSDKVSSPEGEDMDGIQNDEIATSSVEGSLSDAVDAQNEEAEILAYNFLIRIPRFEDENFRDQIRSAQLLVDEKTRIRDAIRAEIHGKRAKLKAHNEAYNAARLEETAARRLVRLKRQEIDSVQVVINRLKNAMSVEDIDSRIINMEHMIQHETLLLKDEKQFIREIKQLKSLRDQLALNMGSPEEIRQAIDQKDANEERMKTLRKELDSLKDKVSKAEAVVKAVGKRYDEESRRERELQAQFRSADDIRQKAYAHLNSLKKLSYDKNKNFRLYKEELTQARDFASRGDKDALHRLCANQVESFMEQWNNNDEFRKEYVNRCNMNAIRRQRALDAGSLVPDDVAPVLPTCNVEEKVDRSLVSIPIEVKSVSVVSDVEKGKKASSTENKHADNNNNINKSIENVSCQKNQTLKTKGLAKPTTLGSDKETVTEEIADRKEEESTLTKEEIELARKAEELKKEEAAAKLKEQRRLEEKAKATEALERKKRNAEKAQLRAELRARKEAEQKEKEREKRLRKKEKKVGSGDNGEEAVVTESSNEAATKENESVVAGNKKKVQKPPAHFFSKQLKPKPIPPPLVNRNKKRWQQWGRIALAIVAIFAVFLLGNGTFYTNYKAFKYNAPF